MAWSRRRPSEFRTPGLPTAARPNETHADLVAVPTFAVRRRIEAIAPVHADAPVHGAALSMAPAIYREAEVSIDQDGLTLLPSMMHLRHTLMVSCILGSPVSR